MTERNRGTAPESEVPESVVESVEDDATTVSIPFTPITGGTSVWVGLSGEETFSSDEINRMGAAVRECATQKADRQTVVMTAASSDFAVTAGLSMPILKAAAAIVAAARTPRAAQGPRTTPAERLTAQYIVLVTAHRAMRVEHGFEDDDSLVLPDSITQESIDSRVAKVMDAAEYAERVRNNHAVTMDDVAAAGLLNDGDVLTIKGESDVATVVMTDDGIRFRANGQTTHASRAAQSIMGQKSVNGLGVLRTADGVVIGTLRTHPDAVAVMEARTADDDDSADDADDADDSDIAEDDDE